MHIHGNVVCVCRHPCFVVADEKNLCVGSELFENCDSLFGTQNTVFGGKSFDYTDLVALSDDAADHSSTFVDWRWTCVMELGCEVFSKQI